MSDTEKILDFIDGKFVLKTSFQMEEPNFGFKGTYEKEIETLDLREAVKNKAYANDRAEKVLSRALVSLYPLSPQLQLPEFLDPHQVEGVKWILSRSRSYLAHAPGAGKTLQAIMAAHLSAVGLGQILFIVPPSLTFNWSAEIKKWLGPLGISIVPESAKAYEMNWYSYFIICPDSMLTREWVLKELIKRKWHFVAVDEASRFKESTSQRTIALFGGQLKNGMRSPGLIQNAKHAVLLDGSPMPNRPMELWAPVYAMSPETIDFMNQQEFGFRYCGAQQNDFGRWEFKYSSNERELQDRLRKQFMHVVTEDELSHPERIRSIIRLNGKLSPEQFEWEKENLVNLRFSDINENISQGTLSTYRKELGLSKAKLIVQYINERFESKNESILLFCWHREVIFRLANLLLKYRPGIIYGNTNFETRTEIFDRFQNGSCKLIIGNLAAMGRGINLQRADRIIFGEYSWCGEANKQAEKRSSRKGNLRRHVRCDYLVIPDSLDELVLQTIFRKDKTVEKVIG